MSVTYTPAPDVERKAKQAIARWHRHLVDVRIEYVFRDTPAKSKGRVVLGKARKMSGLNAALVTLLDSTYDGEEEPEDFFVIEIAEPVWEVLDEGQRMALVDHELAHCTVEETDSGLQLKVLGHDLEEFEAIVRRHGLWKTDVERFVKAAVEAGALATEEDDEEPDGIFEDGSDG